MLIVKFYNDVEDALLKFAVIISKFNGKWVFCKHRSRNTFEIPGGHREYGESILATAKRELIEETGALTFSLKPVCVYSVKGKNKVNESGEEMFGMLFFADISEFSHHLNSEIEFIELFDHLPTDWTYPEIQPYLIKEYQRQKEKENNTDSLRFDSKIPNL